MSRERLAPSGPAEPPATAVRAELEGLRAELAELRAERERVRAELEYIEANMIEVRHDLRDVVSPPANEEEAYFRRLARHMQHPLRAAVPRGSVILVASGGDDEYVRFFGREGRHFPRLPDGGFAAGAPDSALSLIAHLEVQRSLGADFLLVPRITRTWFEWHPALVRHVSTRYHVVLDEEACIVYDLRRIRTAPGDAAEQVEQAILRFRALYGRGPAVLDLTGSRELPQRLREENVFAPTGTGTSAYLGESIDIVVVDRDDDSAVAEATRLASSAVVRVPPQGDDGRVEVTWTPGEGAPSGPSVSIVIPVFEQVAHTRACLASLAETLPSYLDVEIVVVDDASSPETRAFLHEAAAADKRVHVMRNRTNVGFLDSSNRGARRARGEIVVFLNNDTVLLPGWLEALLQVFARRLDVGVVGGRLVYPDGRLQEAGALVFADGSAAKFGYGDPDPEDVLFSNLREVDYVSGCLLATPRALFEELGGFDETLRPGFYEDTDYCFAVRARGLAVVYQPECSIVHVEGATAGLDLSSGMKKHQALNAETFRRKWESALRWQPVRPASVLEREHLYALRSGTTAAIGAAS